MQVHVFAVVIIHRQLKVTCREGAEALEQFKPDFEPRRGLRVGQQLPNRLLVSEDLVLALEGLAVKAQSMAAGQAHCDSEKQEAGQPFPKAPGSFSIVQFLVHQPACAVPARLAGPWEQVLNGFAAPQVTPFPLSGA